MRGWDSNAGARSTHLVSVADCAAVAGKEQGGAKQETWTPASALGQMSSSVKLFRRNAVGVGVGGVHLLEN